MPGGQSSDSVRDECDHTKKQNWNSVLPNISKMLFPINQVLYISFQSNHQRMPGGQSSDSVRDECDHIKKTESEFCPPEHQQKVFSYKSGTLHFLSIKSLSMDRGDRVPTLSGMSVIIQKRQNRNSVLPNISKRFFL